MFFSYHLNQLFVVVSMNYCYVLNAVATTAELVSLQGHLSSYLILALKKDYTM